MVQPSRDGASEVLPVKLLSDYLQISRLKAKGSLSATALRTRSERARQLLAHAAAAGTIGFEELIEAARTGDTSCAGRLVPGDTCELASVIVLQGLRETDRQDSLALYELVRAGVGEHAVPPQHQGMHAQLAYALGDRQLTKDLLKSYGGIAQSVRTHIEADLKNPFDLHSDGNIDEWHELLAKIIPTPLPVLIDDPAAEPFDRLRSVPVGAVRREPKISVIVTTYRPTAGLMTAVRSILDQTWINLEVIIVDDGSPEEFRAIVEECNSLDGRVLVIPLPSNGGTYEARNTGIDTATGEFITFQDSDDWAHPDRLAKHATTLLDDDRLVAVTSEGLKVNADLTITEVGRHPQLMYASSLMFRKSRVLRTVGYYDNVRKAADTEYIKRMEAAFGEEAVAHLTGDVYTLIRRTPGSLSRRDFSGGWIHPARYAYRSAYTHYHSKIRAGEATPRIPRMQDVRAFPAPDHLSQGHHERRIDKRYDVVFASDWRPYGAPQKSMIEEILALTKHGLRIGVLHLEAYRFMTKHRRYLCPQVQDLINAGVVDHLTILDEATVSLLILRYPPVLQFVSDEPANLKVARMIIVANQAPAERDGTDQRYVPDSCTRIAERVFGCEPVWCPQGPSIREILSRELSQGRITEFDMGAIIDVNEWYVQRTRFRSDLPVIGRHSRDHWTKWPEERDTLLQIYPGLESFDVRVMGGGKVPRAVLGGSTPPNWVIYDYDETPVRSFLHQIDFFIYFPNDRMVEAFGRAILEALACGCVVILPHQFSETFGKAAIYCRPDQVQRTVTRFRSSFKAYRQQSERAVEHVRRHFGSESYVRIISDFLD